MRDLDPTSSSPPLDLTAPYESAEKLDANYKALFARDLFPYADAQFLVGRMASPNRLLRHAPELYDQTRTALTANDDESLIGLADDIDIARQLYTPENERPIGTVLSFVTLLEAIRKQSFSIHGAEARTSVLTNLIAKRVADSFPEDQLQDTTQTIYYISNQLKQLQDKTGNARLYDLLETINADLLSLAFATHQRLRTYQYIDRFPTDSGETVTEEKKERDTKHVAELFADIHATQHYGVKMGYIDDPRGGTLIFSPPLDPNEIFTDGAPRHPLMLQDNSVANIAHSRKNRHARIKTQATQPLQGLSVIGNIDDIDLVTHMSLGKDGELYTSHDCRTALVDIAWAKGRYKAYRDMQARILAHYFDITHSIDEVQQVQQRIAAIDTETQSRSKSPMESIGRLVVPRIKGCEHKDAQETYSIQEDRPTRSIRQHEVTWHIRELPEGWHASPTALELAKKLGVTLGANETIVKEHKRGSRLLGEVAAHHLVQRSSKKDTEG